MQPVAAVDGLKPLIDSHIAMMEVQAGKPADAEQGGRIYEIFPAAPGRGVGHRSANQQRQQKPSSRLELAFGRDSLDLAMIHPGAIVWKTDDPEVRKQLDQSFSRDVVARRIPITAQVEARLNQPIRLTLSDSAGHRFSASSAGPLERAQKYPLSLESLRDQLSRLGDTPFELADVTADPLDPVMAPKSVLNDLRRQAAEGLMAARSQSKTIAIANPDALNDLRKQVAEVVIDVSGPGPESHSPAPSFTVLCRSLEQLQAIADWTPTIAIPTVYCDFEDVRKYKEAVAIARAAKLTIALATTRIIKPNEEGLLRQVAAHEPDALLVRNLAGLSFFSEQFPHIPLLGDYSLNVSNELTAGLFHAAGLKRLVPSYDLNWSQLAAMLGRVSSALFEAVIHQHMPMFHMEHCVFCHTLSTGKDYRDCGRPCDTHKVDLRDRIGKQHPLIADVGCRNTVFNATAQSAMEFVPKMLEMGIRCFRVELLRQSAEEVVPLLNRYVDVIQGRAEPTSAIRSLRVLNQLGVSRGTLDHQ